MGSGFDVLFSTVALHFVSGLVFETAKRPLSLPCGSMTWVQTLTCFSQQSSSTSFRTWFLKLRKTFKFTLRFNDVGSGFDAFHSKAIGYCFCEVLGKIEERCQICPDHHPFDTPVDVKEQCPSSVLTDLGAGGDKHA